MRNMERPVVLAGCPAGSEIGSNSMLKEHSDIGRNTPMRCKDQTLMLMAWYEPICRGDKASDVFSIRENVCSEEGLATG